MPSLTDAVFELGAGSSLVGRTRYCVRPAPAVEAIEVVGGTKDPDVERILALAPDLVLANHEENTRAPISRIAEALPVLLSDPEGPRDVPALWRELGAACGREDAARLRAQAVERQLEDAAEVRPTEPPSFVYWIWRDPWMAAGHETYISELLCAAGWRNALPAKHRRYPRLEPAVALETRPSAMLFSSEPYHFELPRDLAGFTGSTRATLEHGVWRLPEGPGALEVDGQLMSWYPSLTAPGLREAVRIRATGDLT